MISGWCYRFAWFYWVRAVVGTPSFFLDVQLLLIPFHIGLDTVKIVAFYEKDFHELPPLPWYIRSSGILPRDPQNHLGIYYQALLRLRCFYYLALLAPSKTIPHSTVFINKLRVTDTWRSSPICSTISQREAAGFHFRKIPFLSSVYGVPMDTNRISFPFLVHSNIIPSWILVDHCQKGITSPPNRQ